MSTWIVVGFLFFKNDTIYEYRNTYDDIKDAFMFYRGYPDEPEHNLLDQPDVEPYPEILNDSQFPYYEYKHPKDTTGKNFFIIAKNEAYDNDIYPEEPNFTEVLCVIRQNQLGRYLPSLDEPSFE